MPAQDPAKQLAKEIAGLRREVSGLSRGSQMNRRSIEGGGIPVYDNDGTLRGTIGQLPDGTTGFETVNGPKPPQPSAPILLPLIGGLEITWDGTYWEDAARPGDFRRVEVHASPYSVYTPDETTHKADFIAPGTLNLQLPPDAYTVIFVVVTTASVRSDPSVPATETPERMPSEAEINAARQDAADAIEAAEAASTQAQTAEEKALEAAGLGTAAQDTADAAAQAAASKGKVYYGTAAPAGDANGLWIDQTGGANTPKRWDGDSWEPVTDKAATDAATAAANARTAADNAQTAADNAQTAAETAQGTASEALTNANAAVTAANGKNKVFWAPDTSPPAGPFINNDLWFVTDKGNLPRKRVGTAWVDAKFEDGALASLNVGKLVAGEIGVGQRIIAGPQFGTHAEMSDTGFRVFREDPTDGIPDEVARMGTTSNDYFAIVGADGNLKAAIDDTGQGNFANLNVTGDPSIMGQKFSKWMSNVPGGGGSGTSVPGARNTYGWNTAAAISNVTSEIGLLEISVNVDKDRVYWIIPSAYFTTASTGVYLDLKVRDGGTGAPTIGSPVLLQDYFSPGLNPAWTVLAERHRLWKFDTSGTHRLLMTATGGAGAVNISGTPVPPTLSVIDLGPYNGNPASVNRGGGSTAPPVQQYFTELAPAGWRTFAGSGAERFDVPGPVQGYDPSGYNGDGWGYWWFNLPSITGTVDRTEFYAYSNHWYYNSGGTARMRLIKNGGGVLTGYSDQGPFPKPGGRTVDLSGWNSYFHNNQGVNRAIGVSVGPGGGTNLTYYGKFDGPSARLRLWYTQ